MVRRSYTELDSKIKKVLEELKEGSIHEIATRAKVNWITTKRILEKFEKLEIVENIIAHQRLKIYRIKK